MEQVFNQCKHLLEVGPTVRWNLRTAARGLLDGVAILVSLAMIGGTLTGCGSSSAEKSPPPPAVAPSSLTYVTITLSATVGVPITPDSNSVAGILAKRVRRDRYNRRWGGHKESKQN